MRVVSTLAVACSIIAAPVCAQEMEATASGLRYVVTRRGNGPAAQPGQIVIAHYTGTLPDGTVFDSSLSRGPFSFMLGKGQVIRGWDEGFALLHVGDKATLVIPPALAYGDKQRGPIPANSTLTFTVELVDLKEHGLGEAIGHAMDARGATAALNRFMALRASNFAGYYAGEAELSMLAYGYYKKNKLPEAITVLSLNAMLYPRSVNNFGHLGEVYAKAGQKDRAIAAYRQALAIDPNSKDARDGLAKLEK